MRPSAYHRGQAFIGQDSHLWIVLSDPIQDPDRILVVNATTWEGSYHKDPACTLDAGDHEFFDHKSFVYFGGARLLTSEEVERLRLMDKTDASDELLARMTVGAAKTRQLRRGYRRLLVEQGFLE